MRTTLPAVVVLATLLAPLTPGAQVRYRVSDPGRWRPWQFTAIASARRDRAATAAEVQAFEARLVELGQILRRAPVVAQPVGFVVGAYGYLAGYSGSAPGQPAGRAVPLAGGFGFGAFSLFEYDRDGKTVREEGIATELLYFEVNQIQAAAFAASKPTEWGPLDTEAFIEPSTGVGFAGHPRVGDVFVIRKNPKPLWLPFSLGDALQPVVTLRRDEFGNRRDAYEKQVAGFAVWQTPAARAARRADWQKTAAMLPNGAEFLKNMESSDRGIETASRERLAPGGPEAKSVAAAEREFREAEASLAALSAEARASAACYDTAASALAARFRAAADAPRSCRALVTPNWAYFDAKLPRSAPQVVMLGLFTRCLSAESLKETNPSGCVINRKLVETLDWDAVLAWLDR
jgi:hypothetical protein